MASTRIRKTQNVPDFEKVIDEYITLGYSIQSRGEDTCKMKKKNYGTVGKHILILILCCWTFGIANILYGAYCYYKGDEVLIKIDE